MGGTWSGRTARYPYTTGDALGLTVRAVLRWCIPGGHVAWNHGGDALASVTVIVRPPAAEVEGVPVWRPVAVLWREGGTERQASLTLVARPQPFGGWRWWWACPFCKAHRGTLYKAGGSPWACRDCLRLPYRSQRENVWQRSDRRLRTLAHRLGVPPEEAADWGSECPDKPAGMHWRTYDRLADEWDAAAHRGAVQWLGMLKRLGAPVDALLSAGTDD